MSPIPPDRACRSTLPLACLRTTGLAAVLSACGTTPAALPAEPGPALANPPALLSVQTACPPTVGPGSTGHWVREVQSVLNYYDSAGLIVDGIYGRLTRAAVIQGQRRNGLDPDGIVGPNTWAKMGYCSS